MRRDDSQPAEQMKKLTTLIVCATLIVVVCSVPFLRSARAADLNSSAPYEYVTLRWDGIANTHYIRPNGTVEFMGNQFVRLKKPDRADDRSFYMNMALNTLAKEGYELASMTPDDYVLKRRTH